MELMASRNEPNMGYSNLKRQNNDFAMTKNQNGILRKEKTYSKLRPSRFAAGKNLSFRKIMIYHSPLRYNCRKINQSYLS